MAFHPFEVNVPHLAYAFLGGFVVIVSPRGVTFGLSWRVALRLGWGGVVWWEDEAEPTLPPSSSSSFPSPSRICSVSASPHPVRLRGFSSDSFRSSSKKDSTWGKL